jgi:hypothetical protein
MIFFSEQLRFSSQLHTLLKSQDLLQLIREKQFSFEHSAALESQLRQDLLASNFFDSEYFHQIIESCSFQLTAQVSFLQEYLQLKPQVDHFLKRGHHLHLWIESVDDLKLVERYFSGYLNQIKPVLFLNKKKNCHLSVNNFQQKEVHFISVPKQNSLDSHLSIEESYNWYKTYQNEFNLKIQYYDFLFLKSSQVEKDFYQNFTQAHFEKLLLKRRPLAFFLYSSFKKIENTVFSPLLSFFKNLFFFIAQPNQQSLAALGDNLWGVLKRVFSFIYLFFNSIYWWIYNRSGRFKVFLEVSWIKSYWKTYSAFSFVSWITSQSYWKTYSLMGLLRIGLIKTKWFFYNLIFDTKRFGYERIIKLRWFFYSLRMEILAKIKILGIKLYWQYYHWKIESLGKWEALTCQLPWIEYRLKTQIIGKWDRFLAEVTWWPSRMKAIFKDILVFLRWKLYHLWCQFKGNFVAVMVQLYWLLFRFLSWQHHMIVQIGWKIHSLSVFTYYRQKEFLLILLWPIRKIYWFLSYQWQTRIKPRIEKFNV